MKTKIVAFFAALAGLIAIGALVAPGAQAGSIPNNVVVATAGTGSGTVTSSGEIGQPINCPALNCSTSYPAGSSATLTATPAPGSVFAGFSGGNIGSSCTQSTNPCTFNVGSGVNNITATFNLAPPNDADGDGTPDSSDGCPNAAGPASNGGCPEPSVEPQLCNRAKTKLAKAKEKLAKLKADDASDKKIDKAKKKVKKAKAKKRKACAAK